MNTSPKRLGKYELLERLGQGGMAEVWKGFDPQLQRLVAIKFLHANLRSDPDFVSRFIREGQAIAALRHPNIVQVYDFQVSCPEDENSMAYMVMDYIEGLTLADYLRRTSYEHKFPTGEEIVHLFTSLGLAVDYAHQHRMIHRDIKPANILLDTRNTMHNAMGEPILTDFGIVKMLGGAAVTSTGISLGTPLYISPEMIRGQPGNEKSDIYALGVILYEVCTGEPPYRGDNPYIILAQRVTGLPDPPSQRNPDISPALDAVILRCLAMEPEERFSSASALTASLAEALDIPIPDLVRHTLSLNHPLVSLTPDISSHSGDLMVDVPASGAPVAVETPVASRGEGPTTGGDTVLSIIDTDVVSALEGCTQRELLPFDNALIAGSALTHTPHPGAPLPSSAKGTGVLIPDVPIQARQRKRWLFPGRIILLIVLVGIGVSTYAFLQKGSGRTPTGNFASIGNATFLNSGQLDRQNTAFMNDGIQVQLSHVPNPAPGQRYYAWGQDHIGAASFIFLGAMQDQQGNATLSYVDSQHRNLLAYVGSFLVTEQAASIIPDQPSRDKTQWRYVATLPHTLSSSDHMSYLDHLRHLLVFDPTLEHFQVHYGINFWLLNTVQELSIQTLEMGAQSNLQEVRQTVVNLLSSLDGPCAHQEMSGTPESKMRANGVIAYAPNISLLDCVQEANQQGYLTRAAYELNAMVNAPGVPVQDAVRAVQMSKALNELRGHLQQMRTEALQVARMDDVHLLQNQILRNDLADQASDIISGGFDPATQTLQPGMKQICNEIAFLAHFDVVLYKSA